MFAPGELGQGELVFSGMRLPLRVRNETRCWPLSGESCCAERAPTLSACNFRTLLDKSYSALLLELCCPLAGIKSPSRGGEALRVALFRGAAIRAGGLFAEGCARQCQHSVILLVATALTTTSKKPMTCSTCRFFWVSYCASSLGLTLTLLFGAGFVLRAPPLKRPQKQPDRATSKGEEEVGRPFLIESFNLTLFFKQKQKC